MSFQQRLLDIIEKWNKPLEDGEGFLIPTTQIYPTGSAVFIKVYQASNGFFITDNGGVASIISESGLLSVNEKKLITSHLRGDDWVVMDSGEISFRKSVKEDLFLSLAFELAELSLDTSRKVLKKISKLGCFDEDWEFFEESLESEFKNYLIKGEKAKLTGASNSPHKFDYVIKRSQIVMSVDLLRSDNDLAINSKIVSNLDVKSSGIPNLRQVIVLPSDFKKWDSAKLSMLSLSGAELFSKDVALEKLRIF